MKNKFQEAALKAIKKFDQIEYMNEYNKSTYKNYSIRIRKTETELINYLDMQESKNAYIINLIKKDMKK